MISGFELHTLQVGFLVIIIESRGVEIDYPTVICFPFERGLLGWVAEIRMWKPDTTQWTKMETTTGFETENDGSPYQACAQTYFAGKYALFGVLK